MITFSAIVYKVQTLAADNGIRVTFDLPETAIVEAAALMECKRNEIALKVTVEEDIPIKEKKWLQELKMDDLKKE